MKSREKMQVINTEIEIDASPQTIWAILDDIARYDEWNPVVPRMQGKTVVDSQLDGQLIILDKVDKPFPPTVTRIVGARQFRWVTVRPDSSEFIAEHCFTLEPLENGRTHLKHFETFEGTLVEGMWPLLDTAFREAYEQFNVEIKKRAEEMILAKVSLHPSISDRSNEVKVDFSGATLKCQCEINPVEVQLKENVAHNHLCGCSKCWKPEGSLFSQVAVAPKETVLIVSNKDKLSIIDDSQSIKRHACKECGTHMVGKVIDPEHHFYDISFVHPELVVGEKLGAPTFAAFVSSIIESGACPSEMEAVRESLNNINIPAYDAFTPELMDIIAWHKVKLANNS